MNDIIFDLDNCLADDSERIPLIRHDAPPERRWTAYHDRCGQDAPANMAVLAAAYNLITPINGVILFHTGRPEAVRAETEAWLAKHAPWCKKYELRMRPIVHDVAGSVELKRWQLGQARRAGRVPVLAFDDRPDIVKMYNDENVAGIALRIHDDESPYNETDVALARIEPAAKPDNPAKPEDWSDVDALADLRPRKAPRNLPSVPEILADAASTFEARNAAYGNAYAGIGRVLRAMWPDGLRIQGEEEFGRLALLIMCVGKMHRYASSFATGHIDSARDAAVYAAMLEELTRAAHGEPLELRRG